MQPILPVKIQGKTSGHFQILESGRYFISKDALMALKLKPEDLKE